MNRPLLIVGFLGALSSCSLDPIPYPIARDSNDGGAQTPIDAPVLDSPPARPDVVAEVRDDRQTPPDILPPPDVPPVQPSDVVQPRPDVQTCVTAGATCRIDNDCCTRVCAGGSCLFGSEGERCVSPADCLFNAPCAGGTCQCQVSGGRCYYTSECCSRRCNLDSRLCE